jgi:hypothetical protein
MVVSPGWWTGIAAGFSRPAVQPESLAQIAAARRLDVVNVPVSPGVVGKRSRREAMNRHCVRLLQRGGAGIRRSGLLAFVALLALSPLARADDELPGRVGRVAQFGGDVYIAPQDRPDQWSAIGLNYPVTSGDNLWVANDGHAEIDFGGGQLRLAGNTNLHVSRLDERNFALFVAQGGVILRVRFLDPGDSARVDTPNAQIVLARPGLYRIEVTEDRRHTQLAVREGEAGILVAVSGQQVLPGQSAGVDGVDPQDILVRNGFNTDGFDAWSADRDRRYERSRASSYVSRQMVGAADLDDYGTWESVPDYGAVWYPSAVAADWAPYRYGYWTDVGAWGPTWVDAAPWGYAPFHYGRWAYVRGRWGWCPGNYVARPAWAPALVGWVGGPGWDFSTVHGGAVYGWVPLGWGEPYRPSWGRCGAGCWERYNRPYAVNAAERSNAPPARFANGGVPGALTAVPGAAFGSRQPVQSHRVNVPENQIAFAPVLPNAPPARPEPGRIPGIRPGSLVPPPASTAYASGVRRDPANPFGAAGTPPGAGAAGVVPPAARQGSTGPIPATGTVVAVPPATRPAMPALSASPLAEPPIRSAPTRMSPAPAVPTWTPPSTANVPQPQVNTYNRPAVRPSPTPPATSYGSLPVPPAGRQEARSLPVPQLPVASPSAPAKVVPQAGAAIVRPAPQLAPMAVPPSVHPGPVAPAVPGASSPGAATPAHPAGRAAPVEKDKEKPAAPAANATPAATSVR